MTAIPSGCFFAARGYRGSPSKSVAAKRQKQLPEFEHFAQRLLVSFFQPSFERHRASLKIAGRRHGYVWKRLQQPNESAVLQDSAVGRAEDPFQVIAKLLAQRFLTEPLSHDLSADLTHPRQRRAACAAQRLDRVHRSRDIAVRHALAESILVEQIGHVGGMRSKIKDGPPNGHGAIDLAGMNNAYHFVP